MSQSAARGGGNGSCRHHRCGEAAEIVLTIINTMAKFFACAGVPLQKGVLRG